MSTSREIATIVGVKPTTRRRPQRLWMRSRKIRVGFVLVGIFVLLGIVGPWIAPYDPSAISQDILQPPSWAHPFGTTSLGEDVFSQVVAGARLSLLVGFVAALLSETVAILVGITGGFLGGLADEGMSLLTNIFLVIPVLPLQILIIAYIGDAGWFLMAVVIALTHWPHGARKLRAQTLSIRHRDYIEAARAAGESRWRIVVYEIMPNELAIISAGFLFSVLSGIIIQTSLAFLGLGDITSWSWGSILRWSETNNAFLVGAWWWIVPPGICLALVGTGLAMINLGIDEVINPRLRGIGGKHKRRRALLADTAASAAAATERPAEDPVLKIRGLEVVYGSGGGELPAVRGVDLDLRRGEVLGLAGESGSGKSTLAFAVTRLLHSPGRVAGGEVTFLGRNSDGTPAAPFDVLAADREALRQFRWEKTAVVFQAAMNSLNPVLTVRTQLTDTMAAHRPRMTKAQRTARAEELLGLVGIDVNRLDAYPHQLSGGQRQRVMIAMALALEPAIVILDEPTTSLDVVVQRDILRCIMDLRSRLDCSFIFITHDVSLLLEIADRIAVMYAGRIVEYAPARDLRDHPRHPYTRRLLGSFPSLHGERRKLVGIKGSPPDLRNMPTGCAFHPRCRLATPECAATDPALVATGPGRGAACLHLDLVDTDSITEPVGAGER